MIPINQLFQTLIDAYVRATIRVPSLKACSLAQWIVESGRGTSDLATQHLNFAGLKWRADRMEGIDASPVQYEAHDGTDTYTKFGSLEAFIQGFWAFIEKGPYGDPADFDGDCEGYIDMLLEPPPYATDPNYKKKIEAAYPEAVQRLRESADRQGIDLDLPAPPSHQVVKLAVMVGHNSTKPGACSPHIGICEYPWNTEVAGKMEQGAPEMGINMRTFFRTYVPGNIRAEIERAYVPVNEWDPDLVLELHYNGFNGAAHGSEMLHWPNSSAGIVLAQAVQDEVLRVYQLADRGLKPTSSGSGSISLGAARAPAVLTEPFFGDNKRDAQTIMSRGGTDTLAQVYLRAVANAAAELGLGAPVEPPPVEPPVEPPEPPASEIQDPERIVWQYGDRTLVFTRTD